MEALVELVREQLETLGITASFAPEYPHSSRQPPAYTASLQRGCNQQTYLTTCVNTTHLAPVGPIDADHPPLAIAHHIGPRTADAYRRAEVQYVDVSGNAWLQFGDVLIDVQGRRPATPIRNRVAGNLFTTSRAQVAFALLTMPALWKSTQRELANASGVSLGQANNALRLLIKAGYGPDGHRHNSELLRLWTATFPTGLAQRLTLATFRGDIERIRPVDGEAIYRSGEIAATELLRPATATLYVEDLDSRLALINRWRTDTEPNIVVRRAFWRPPIGRELTPRMAPEAPWTLVYADLLASDDSRVRGVAEEWRKNRA